MAEKKKKNPVKAYARGEQLGARRALLEELFNDLYNDRRNIYFMNFIRGLFFGAGSVLGGTILVALLVWVLSLFVQIPVIGQQFQQAQDRLESSQSK